MTIGILTIHCNYNVGAMLQSYALQEYLKSIGHEVRIINYRPSYLLTRNPLPICRSLSLIRQFKSIMTYPNRLKSYSRFKEFENLLDETEPVYHRENIESVASRYDVVIWGSDQIWCSLFNGKDSVWFGDVGLKGTKKISYAASAGDVDEKDEFLKGGIEKLREFSAVSVREEKLASYINSVIGFEPTVVLDPSLLVDREVWDKWSQPIVKGKYVLIRQARFDRKVIEIARDISNQLNSKVVTCDCTYLYALEGVDIEVYSPIDFVSLVHNATCIVTNSYHGTAFSIALRKDFYMVKMNDGQDERSTSLLHKLGLEDRIISKDDIPSYRPADYDACDAAFSKLQEWSRKFIIDSLSGY